MFNKKIIFILASVITVLLFLIMLLMFLMPSKLELLEAYPENNSEQISLKPEIVLTFNRKVDPKNFSYEINPTVELEVKADKKNLIYTPKTELSYKTQYNIRFLSEKLDDGEYLLSFTTKNDNQVAQNEETEHAKATNELSLYLPIVTKEYNIDYWANDDSFIITMKWPPCDIAKRKVETWFSEKGFDYTKLKIVWTAEKGLPDECYFE